MPLRRLLFSVLLLAGSSAFAAVEPSLFQDLRWRLIGPFRGGRVLAVTGVPGEPEHFYFGAPTSATFTDFRRSKMPSARAPRRIAGMASYCTKRCQRKRMKAAGARRR